MTINAIIVDRTTIGFTHSDGGSAQLRIHPTTEECDIAFIQAADVPLDHRIKLLKQAQLVAISMGLHKPGLINFGPVVFECSDDYRIGELCALIGHRAKELQDFGLLDQFEVWDFPMSRAHFEEMLAMMGPHGGPTCQRTRQVEAWKSIAQYIQD